MNADAFRHLYAYHFAENRKLWDSYIIPLSDEQFAHPVDYSHGSVRDQVVHLMSVDAAWFSGLRGDPPPPEFALDEAAARPIIRARWDGVEQRMREYLAGLQDDMLFTKPFSGGEDKDLILWQVLLHVVNHGTDHRAQLLRVLNDLGVETTWQDYIFYTYRNP